MNDSTLPVVLDISVTGPSDDEAWKSDVTAVVLPLWSDTAIVHNIATPTRAGDVQTRDDAVVGVPNT